jgi:hypothetical protein
MPGVSGSVPEQYSAPWKRVCGFLEDLYSPITAQIVAGQFSGAGSLLLPGKTQGWPRHSFAIGACDEYFLLHIWISRQKDRTGGMPFTGLLLRDDQTPNEVAVSERIVCGDCLRPTRVGILNMRLLYEECVCAGTTSKRLTGKVGERVRLGGLSKADMNDLEGILKPFDPKTGRHPVQLDTKKTILVRPENIELASVLTCIPWEEGLHDAQDNERALHEKAKTKQQKRAYKKPEQEPIGSENFGMATKAQQKQYGKLYRCTACEQTFSERLLVCQRCKVVGTISAPVLNLKC